MKNIVKVTFVIIGTAIGAGFASGKEIFLFFNTYGAKGIIGIIISSLLSGYLIYKVFAIVQKKKIQNYEDFLEALHKSKRKKGITINSVINSVINLFLLITFYIMIAGFSAYFSQELKVPAIVGSAIISIFCYLTFIGDGKAVVKASSLLVPLLIAMILLLGMKGITRQVSNYYYSNSGSWLISAILYSSYNSILLIPILITLQNYIRDKKEAFFTGVISTVILIRACLHYLFFNTKNRGRCQKPRITNCLYCKSIWTAI